MSRSGVRTNRRTYLRTMGLTAAGTVGIAGCLGSETGMLATYVTDQPTDIDDFEACVVSIAGIWLGPADASTATATVTDGEREYIPFETPQDADLVELQDGSTALLDERELETAEHAYLQLDVDDITATLVGGDDADVTVPGDAPLTFNEPFEIRPDTRTAFTADFTPVQQGATGRYVLQPVPDGIQVTYDGS